MIPLLIGIFYLSDTVLSDEGKNLSAALIFALASVTDWLDGFLARRFD